MRLVSGNVARGAARPLTHLYAIEKQKGEMEIVKKTRYLNQCGTWPKRGCRKIGKIITATCSNFVNKDWGDRNRAVVRCVSYVPF